jgi:hypothetical protein
MARKHKPRRRSGLKTLAKLGGIATPIAVALIITILEPETHMVRDTISNWLKPDPLS